TNFTAFFGFAPDYTSNNAAGINGDDAIELFVNGQVGDVFGDINLSGTGTPWDYLDGWAYRADSTGPDGSTFVLGNWTFSGVNNLEGDMVNSGCTAPFPVGTFNQPGQQTSGIPTYDIGQVTTSDAGGVADSLSVVCKINGVVYSVDFD